MRLLLLAAYLCCVPCNGSNRMIPMGKAVSAAGVSSAGAGSHREPYRTLLVCAPTEKDSRYVQQLRMLSGGVAELRERQVLVVPLVERSSGDDPGPALRGVEGRGLTGTEASAVRRRFKIADREFAVVLIGKDGGEKFRTQAPVTIERLDAVIDRMPMRQQEERDGLSK